MKRIFCTFAVSLALMTICPAAMAQFSKAYGKSMSGKGYGRNPSAGYLQRGFKLGIDVDNGASVDGEYIILGNVSAGYQFNPYFYLGASAGPGFEVENCLVLTSAAEAKAYFSSGRFAPMASLKLGYLYVKDYYYDYKDDCFSPAQSLYVSGGIGARWAINTELGLNIQLVVSNSPDWMPVFSVRTGIDF